jgi:hypothetical protein
MEGYQSHDQRIALIGCPATGCDQSTHCRRVRSVGGEDFITHHVLLSLLQEKMIYSGQHDHHTRDDQESRASIDI